MKIHILILFITIPFFSFGQVDIKIDTVGYRGYMLVLEKKNHRVDTSMLEKLDPTWIKRVEILKSEDEKYIYGNNNGLTLIYPKKKYSVIIENIIEDSKLKNRQNILAQKELNIVVDEIVRNRLHRVSVIQMETMPVCFKLGNNKNSKTPPPPPPSDRIEYSQNIFDSFTEIKSLSRSDSEYMISSTDASKTFIIDSCKVSKEVTSKAYLDTIFDSDSDFAYDRIKQEFGTSCFIRVSTPIFNRTMDKLVLAVDYYCGYLCGQGLVLVLEKKAGKWMIIDERGTWES
ncbi:hypothetical protein [Carboxylicivirga marina]|uniref:hypothetical protein n=1 Tax=Carboxylicivirga marina TaxID=2800988 RepID=UPI002592AC89|nr:hypothetical protein [uncultured Carboxylicivirga sp.]